jgi:hypothetical protein
MCCSTGNKSLSSHFNHRVPKTRVEGNNSWASTKTRYSILNAIHPSLDLVQPTERVESGTHILVQYRLAAHNTISVIGSSQRVRRARGFDLREIFHHHECIGLDL